MTWVFPPPLTGWGVEGAQASQWQIPGQFVFHWLESACVPTTCLPRCLPGEDSGKRCLSPPGAPSPGSSALSSSLWGFACFLFQGHRPCLRETRYYPSSPCVTLSDEASDSTKQFPTKFQALPSALFSVLTVSANNTQGKSAWFRSSVTRNSLQMWGIHYWCLGTH